MKPITELKALKAIAREEYEATIADLDREIEAARAKYGYKLQEPKAGHRHEPGRDRETFVNTEGWSDWDESIEQDKIFAERIEF